MQGQRTCPKCQGTRLNEQALVFAHGGPHHCPALRHHGSTARVLSYYPGCDGNTAGKRVFLLEQIRTRLDLLADLDLNYLSLDGSTHTLSTGELQQLRY